MMSLNEALTRNRLFWATYVKVYSHINLGYDDFVTTKVQLFKSMFPHLVKDAYPHCFACHYNMERPQTDHCIARCILTWPNDEGCSGENSPYENMDAKGILNCIDQAIKRYDLKRYRKDERVMRRFIK